LKNTDHKRKFRNCILKRLPSSSLKRLRKGMKEVRLAQGTPLYEPREHCKHVYFPETGVASILTVLKDGTETEVASVGYEGVIGLPVFFGAKASSRKAVYQISGTAYRIDAATVEKETRAGGPLTKMMSLYSQALFTQLAQAATCNRLHTIEQRCCCWLLLTLDRVIGNEFDLTHEFLSEMLGARRAGVTVVAGKLQRKGLIRYRRGRVTIRNRKGLEKAACECYRTVKSEFDRLLR
jgi:CRP-like cAMP-binding protein